MMSNKALKLSIITINYNNVTGLKKTIDSVITQIFADYEWIVIDGGSSDGSKELIEQYSDYFAYWCSEPDSGIYHAMNKGIDKASGQYLQFLNSGDTLHSDQVLKQVFESENEADLMYGDFQLQDDTYVRRFPEKITLTYILTDCLNHQASFYKRELFEKERYDESFKIVSDWAFNFHLLLQNKTLKHLPFIVIDFEPNGIGCQLTEDHLQEKTRALQKHIPVALQDEISVIKNAAFVYHRKSYRRIMELSFRFCQWLEPILRKIETKSLFKK